MSQNNDFNSLDEFSVLIRNVSRSVQMNEISSTEDDLNFCNENESRLVNGFFSFPPLQSHEISSSHSKPHKNRLNSTGSEFISDSDDDSVNDSDEDQIMAINNPIFNNQNFSDIDNNDRFDDFDIYFNYDSEVELFDRNVDDYINEWIQQNSEEIYIILNDLEEIIYDVD